MVNTCQMLTTDAWVLLGSQTATWQICHMAIYPNMAYVGHFGVSDPSEMGLCVIRVHKGHYVALGHMGS